MAPKEDKKNLVTIIPGHQQLILGGLARYKIFDLPFSNIITTTLLIPLDVFQLRLRYPDTWCMKMFRIMVSCKGCPGPYEVLSARMLQKRTYASLRWGIFYCLYVAHKRNCKLKAVNPLWQGTFLLTGRPVVMHAVKLGTAAAVLDYMHEWRRVRERKLISEWLKGFRSSVSSILHDVLSLGWPMEALETTLMMQGEHHQHDRTPRYVKVGFAGGISGIIASVLLHPLDVFKVRLQLFPEAWGVSLLRNMLRCEGIRAPYTGVTASILRQTTYTTTRLGTYSYLYETHRRKTNSAPNLYNKLSMGVCSGVAGAFVGCPSEVILVRMMADGPVDPYRRYKNVVDALVKIWRTEGVSALWRGAMLSMSKSAVISVSQIATYSQARNYFVERKRARGFLLHLYASILSSFVTALVTLPLDTFKTRYQVANNGTHRDVYQKFRQDSSMLGLWRGFTPYYLRLTIHTLVTFYLLKVLFRNKTKKPKHKE